jgi:hypothetical protein
MTPPLRPGRYRLVTMTLDVGQEVDLAAGTLVLSAEAVNMPRATAGRYYVVALVPAVPLMTEVVKRHAPKAI